MQVVNFRKFIIIIMIVTHLHDSATPPLKRTESTLDLQTAQLKVSLANRLRA